MQDRVAPIFRTSVVLIVSLIASPVELTAARIVPTFVVASPDADSLNDDAVHSAQPAPTRLHSGDFGRAAMMAGLGGSAHLMQLQAVA